MEKTNKQKQMKGVVTSNKMQNTVVVAVSSYKKHEKYHKFEKVVRKFKAHDATGQLQIGDNVVIEETRPISKSTHFIVVK